MTQFLIRFDDLCPTMNWAVWQQVEEILNEYQIRPMIAVVPDNRDAELDVAPARPDFWNCVRGWQERGWTIALHGYQHVYVTSDSGLIGKNPYSEFAGLSEAAQEKKLRAGLEIMHRESVFPDTWIAPGHSFDSATVKILHRLGIRTISDGYFFRPFTDAAGVFWIPQQDTVFLPIPGAVWTVCFHVNGWTTKDIEHFRGQVKKFRNSITSVSEIRNRYASRQNSSWDRAFDSLWQMRLNAGRQIRSLISNSAVS